MPKKPVELLLTESVEGLGIVGDVVIVKPGYARNYLLPHGYGVVPTERAKKALEERRAQAKAEREAIRKDMESMFERMENAEVSIERSCNDQGFLYGSVTQGDIEQALIDTGFLAIQERHIRIGASIKRIDSYMIPIQLDSDLKTEIKLWVVADRELSFDDDRDDDDGKDDSDKEKVDEYRHAPDVLDMD